MSGSNRADLITKTQKVLKKHYEPVKPPADRSVLEHLLYACCLENAKPSAADDAMAKLFRIYFDLNEIRVTTVSELAESMSSLPDPGEAATRLKRVLQSIFEKHYSFDIDILRKQNLGAAIKELEKVDGTTAFAVAYVAQNGLGGHSIPTSKGVIDAMQVLGVISEAEANAGRVPGLERAIPKNKGVEFGSLLHQFGADFYHSPHSSKVKSILLEIAPDAKDRLPKRAKTETESESDDSASGRGKTKAKSAKSGGKPSDDKPKKKKKASAAASSATAKKKKAVLKKKASVKKSPTKQLSRKKPR